MRTSKKIIVGIAIAGLAAVGGAAFTGTGLDQGSVPTAVFVGGTVSQSLAGAALVSVTYGYVDGPDGPKTTVNLITVVMTGEPADAVVTLTPTVDGVAEAPITLSDTALQGTYLSGATAYTGLDSIDITVAAA